MSDPLSARPIAPGRALPATQPDDEPMTGAELRTVTEFLGFDQQDLARQASVSDRTVRRWFTGEFSVPGDVSAQVLADEEYTARVIGEVVERLLSSPDPGMIVYGDDDWPVAAAEAGVPARFPARWWRHVVARVAQEIPGLTIVGPTTARPAPGVDPRRRRGAQAAILADLRRQILSGAIPDGEELPRGAALAETWGVSRATIDLVMSKLRAEGLISPAMPGVQPRVMKTPTGFPMSTTDPGRK